MREYRVKVPANGGREIDTTGDVVFVVESTQPVKIRAVGESDIYLDATMRTGQKARLRGEFKQLQLTNQGGAEITVTLISGLGDFDGNVAEGITVSQLSGSVLVDHEDETINAGATEQVVPANTSRKEVIMKNDDLESSLRIGRNPSATRGITLEAGMTLILNTSDEVRVHNPNAGAVSLSILEIEQ